MHSDNLKKWMNPCTRLYVILLLVMISCTTGLVAQSESDTLVVQNNVEDSSSVKKNTFIDLLKGEPGRAALYALLIPGGGQIYNKKWWKVPIAIGIDAYTFYNVYDTRKNYKYYQDQLKLNLSGESTELSTEVIRLRRNSYRKKYDYARVYFILGHLLTIVDAYVDRHLMDFDMSEDLSIEPTLSPTSGLGFGICYRF